MIALVLALWTSLSLAQGFENIEYFDPNLIGGEVADPKDWPASPWVGNCSSTLIGERVLLTAAHCVGNGRAKSFTIENRRYEGLCTHHPEYRGNSTADWALCHLTTPVEGVKFEVVATISEVQCTNGKQFLWTGYGCTRWGSRIDGKFRTGRVPAIRCPSRTNYDTVTRGSVALCSGDSGGGGYVVAADGTRKVVGVNSRSNTTDTSYVSSTYVQTFQDWAVQWANTKGAKICGYHPEAQNCRSAQPQPGCEAEEAEVLKAEINLELAKRALEECRSRQ